MGNGLKNSPGRGLQGRTGGSGTPWSGSKKTKNPSFGKGPHNSPGKGFSGAKTDTGRKTPDYPSGFQHISED